MDIVGLYARLDAMPLNSRADRNELIKATEENMEFIEACCIDEESADYPYAARIIFEYADCLLRQSSYKKALPYLDKAVFLCESRKGFDANNTEIGYYERLVGIRAMACYYTKGIERAKREFEWLCENYPENDTFRRWLAAARVYSMERTAQLLVIVMLALFFTRVFVLSERYLVLRNCFHILEYACLFLFVILYTIAWWQKRKISSR